MKKFIALALSVASLVAAAEMALAPGTMKHKYVAPNDYVTTNAWMTVSNKVDALIENKADSRTWPSPSVVSNISANVTSNVVTKQYVEGLGIVSGEDNAVVLTNGSLKTKSGSVVKANNVGAVETNAYWTIKKGSEDGIGVRQAASGIGSTFFIGYNSFGNVDQGGHLQYSSGGYEDFFNGSVLRMLTGSQLWWLTGAKPWLQTADNFKIGGSSYAGGTTLPNWVDGRITTSVPSWARSSTKPTYSASEVGAATESYVDQQNENTRAIVYSWENFLDGSNVVFSITNYISGTYNLAAAKLRIMEMTNGVYREVYNSRDEIVMHIDNFKTNDFRVATNAVISSVDSKIANKADKAWGRYTSTGGEAPSNTVVMTEQYTKFAGGTEYYRFAVGEGMISVLTTCGAPTYTTGDEGTFKFQDDGGTNYFGFAKSDSYVIGCNTDGISVQNNIVTLTYNVTMSGVPCIWYKEDLSTNTPWEQLNLPDGTAIAGASHVVTWEGSPSPGTEVCYINCPEPKGFFKATIEVAGSAKFMTNMPADLSGGIICTNTATGVNGIIRPSYNGSSVIWTWSAQ